jgi:transposase-like protein
MRELSVAEQRYQAVLGVISDGLSISQVAEKVGVSRQTLHSWLARYETQGLDVHATVDLRFVQVLNRAAELSLGPLELESRHDWGHCKKMVVQLSRTPGAS